MEHPPNAETHISMTAEVQELLSCAVLDTSSQASGSSTPKRLVPVPLGAPFSSRVEDASKLVATSSQVLVRVATPDITKLIYQTPKWLVPPPPCQLSLQEWTEMPYLGM